MLTKKKIKYLLDNEFVIPDGAICYYGTNQVVKHYCSFCHRLFIPKSNYDFLCNFCIYEKYEVFKEIEIKYDIVQYKNIIDFIYVE